MTPIPFNCDLYKFCIISKNFSTLPLSSGLYAGRLIILIPNSVNCSNEADTYSFPLSVTIVPGINLLIHSCLPMSMLNFLHNTCLSETMFSISPDIEWIPPFHDKLYP